MPFRETFSRLTNAPEARAETTLEAVVVINGLKMGRVQGLRKSLQAGPRPVDELGSDISVEIVPGIKKYNGSLQSITIRYGDLVKRLASMAGGVIDTNSKAATLSNMPEFDIAILRRGTPTFGSPQLYAPTGGSQDLVGSGGVVSVLVGCVIATAEQTYGVQDALVMESCTFQYIDEVFPTRQ